MFGFISSEAAFLIANPMLTEFILGLLIGQALLSRALPGPRLSAGLLVLGIGLLAAQHAAVTDFGFWRALVWGGPSALIVAGAAGIEASGRWPRLALLEGLSLEETLRAFGEHYRAVLANPDGSDHGNIRALQTHGLAGVRFSQQALQRNA